MQLKPQIYETFEQFYTNGPVRLRERSTHLIKSVDDLNKIERKADDLDEIYKNVYRSIV